MFLRGTMWPEKFALTVAIVVFIGGSVGLILQATFTRNTQRAAPAT